MHRLVHGVRPTIALEALNIRREGSRNASNLWDDTTYLRTARGMSVVVSSLTPSLAIVILYFIHDLIARILTAMGLSFIFSVALAFSTPARPAEIFAASAA
jgi:hypothetical protein